MRIKKMDKSLSCICVLLIMAMSALMVFPVGKAWGATRDDETESWKSRALKAEDELTKLRATVETYKPKLPQPTPLTLDPKTTALLVLDLSNRCNDPAQVCNQLAPRIKDFLPKTRASKVFTVYTVSAGAKDTPQGKVWDNFGALPDEPVITPDAIDKFFGGGELASLLQKRGIKTVIITGASTNNAVLYTATSAARMYKYNVVIPLDGVIAKNSYESEFPIYQFTVLASGANERFSFTTLRDISFK